MTPEIRGMLIGVCIVILAVAAWLLKDKPADAPGGSGAAVTSPEKR